MAKAKISFREFLEPANSGTDSYVAVFGDSEGWLDLTVADCGQRVSLGFSIDSWRKTEEQWKARRERKLAKLEKLEWALALIRDALESTEYTPETEEDK